MNKIWNWFDGKKTTIAVIYWTAISNFIPIWFASGLPSPWDKVNLTIGTMLSVLGLGHKFVKAVESDIREGDAK